MRRGTVAVTLLALALALMPVIASASSQVDPPSAAGTAAREAAAKRAAPHPATVNAPEDVFTINDGFVSRTYNHLGKPSAGILTAETWGETGWIEVGDGTVALNNSQGVVRALKQSKVLRVEVQVELWGIDSAGSSRRLATSSKKNSGTATSVQVATPEVNLRTAPCLLWTRALVSIRWTDNRLSRVSFEMPVGYFNLDEHC